jgi:hypothetical protein
MKIAGGKLGKGGNRLGPKNGVSEEDWDLKQLRSRELVDSR